MKKKKKPSRAYQRAYNEEYALASVSLCVCMAMHDSKMTQRKLATRSKVKERVVAQMCNVSGNPTIKNLAAVAEALGYTCHIQFIKSE